MNIQLIQVRHLDASISNLIERSPETEEYDYTAIAIEDKGRYYYWAKGISLEVSRQEYEAIKTNQKLYYFSTALWLHLRIMSELTH